MIDIHCHILPGIDDGAKTMDESLLILKKAEQAGVTDIVLTPHYMRGTIYNADNVKKWQLYQELRKRAKEAGIKVNLYLGNEIYIDESLPEMLSAYANNKHKRGNASGNLDNASGKNDAASANSDAASAKNNVSIYDLATLNSRKYVLVEFPMQTPDKSAPTTLFKLVQDGFVPVIAHPERYLYVQDDPDYIVQFLQMGCVLQGDYLALAGKYGKRAEKTLKKLLQEDKIFCLASDIHKGSDSYKLDLVTKKLEKILKSHEKVNQLLHDNPARVIA